MATKAKTAPTAPVETTLEARLGNAISLVEAGKPTAGEVLDALIAAASTQGNVAIARTARNYRLALDRKLGEKPKPANTVASDAILLLNGQRPEEALPLLDAALAKNDAQAHLLYLRACALVQLSRLEDGAEALRKAFTLEPSLRFQYRLEPDFNPARRHPGYVDFETA